MTLRLEPDSSYSSKQKLNLPFPNFTLLIYPNLPLKEGELNLLKLLMKMPKFNYN